MMITRSPGATSRAAAPLRQMSPPSGAPGDHVGLEPGAVVDVDHGDLLVLEQVGRIHQVAGRW